MLKTKVVALLVFFFAVSSPPSLAQMGDSFNGRRCPPGTRKDNFGICVNTQGGYGSVQRCPNGYRRDEYGSCVPKSWNSW